MFGLNPEMREQQQQTGNKWVLSYNQTGGWNDPFFAISFDHRLQFLDFFRCHFSLDETIHSINNRQHS